ncbi:DUF2911 domain-containing protein [Marinoscillum sp.]|uniref:DUF2911 domain-containing protein n=1 Tax=Marinoscillum sp. TaxID=2024838 RepID=UPI003BA9383F
MIKKILIGVGILVVLLAAGAGYMIYRGYALSPSDQVQLTNGDLEVSVDYCRPSVRDRLIFGQSEEGALQPYGQYWRLGANESTEIEFNQDILLVDQEIPKGRYRMYTVPGEHYFELFLNSELGVWGAIEPNKELDLASVMIPVQKADPTEQFTIRLEPLYDNSVKLFMEWSNVRLEVPVIVNN